MIDLSVTFDSNFWLTNKLTKAARAMSSGNMLREAEVEMGETAQALALNNTPVVSGSWASSWAVFVEGDETFLTIAPTAVNPYSDENPPEYGPKVHGMGGVSPSGHRRDVLNVLLERYSEDITDAGGEYVIASLRAVLS